MDINEMLGQDLPEDLNRELLRLSGRLEKATTQLRRDSLKFAGAEHAYRRSKAQAYLTAKTSAEKATIPQLEALVDKSCEMERAKAYVARAMKESSLELVKSLRAQLSALQSIAATVRSEAELASGPQPQWSRR